MSATRAAEVTPERPRPGSTACGCVSFAREGSAISLTNHMGTGMSMDLCVHAHARVGAAIKSVAARGRAEGRVGRGTWHCVDAGIAVRCTRRKPVRADAIAGPQSAGNGAGDAERRPVGHLASGIHGTSRGSLHAVGRACVCVKTRGRARARRDELEGLRLTLEGSVAGLAAYVEQAMCARQHREIAVRLNSPLFRERLFIHTHGHENEQKTRTRRPAVCVCV